VALDIGDIRPMMFMKHINDTILPSLDLGSPDNLITERTARRWLLKLGYRNCEVRKGLYIDGHERPDVVRSRAHFIQIISQYRRFVIMAEL
jgi:hypothetical protein